MNDLNDMNDDSFEDQFRDLFDGYTRRQAMTRKKRRSFGVPAILASSPNGDTNNDNQAGQQHEGESVDTSGNADNDESLQQQQQSEQQSVEPRTSSPSLSVTHSADAPIRQNDQTNNNGAISSSPSSSQESVSSRGSESLKSSMSDEERNAFLSKQVNIYWSYS
jgi:hypothetical protein